MVPFRFRLALVLAMGAWMLGSAALPGNASAQAMDLALARLRFQQDPGMVPGTPCGFGTDVYCQDDEAWERLATEFTGGLLPPLLTPARTRGPRSFYLGIEGFVTGISSGLDANGMVWRRGTEGDGGAELPEGSPVPGAPPYGNRFPQSVAAWTRINIRKALPFGFDLGTSIAYMPNTSYWSLGLEIRWAILEGWQSRDWWVPDIAIRGAVQTLVGDAEFNATTVAVDLTISNAIVVGDELELSPYIAGQLAWAFADTELVDLTPERDAFALCRPDPTNYTANPCLGDGTDYNNNVVFSSIRTMRPRMVFGLQGRYEVFTLTGAFSFDLLTPSEMDGRLPQPVRDATTGALVTPGIDRQWRVDFGIGLSY